MMANVRNIVAYWTPDPALPEPGKEMNFKYAPVAGRDEEWHHALG